MLCATTTNVPKEPRWLELARVIVNLSGHVRLGLPRVGGLEQITRSIQEAVQSSAQLPGAETSSPADHNGSNSFVGKRVVPEGATNKADFEQWSRRYNFEAESNDDRLNDVLDPA